MNLLWAVLILAAAVTVAVGAMLFVRRTAPARDVLTDTRPLPCDEDGTPL